MALYNNINEMIQDAVSQGIINVMHVSVKINNMEINIPNTINVIDGQKWKYFLLNIINNTDAAEEKKCASQFLQVLNQVEQAINMHDTQEKQEQTKIIMQGETARRSIISSDEITNLKIDLAKCDSTDDVFKLIGIPVLPAVLKWKRPIKINDTTQYHSYDTNWYITKRILNKNIIYSLYNTEHKEIARFDKIKNAKDNAREIIARFI